MDPLPRQQASDAAMRNEDGRGVLVIRPTLPRTFMSAFCTAVLAVAV